ncbi:MAG: type III pantothenate kinase [Planctomycetota bacterium]|nr:type III pantothenate kinase [Planctomycetota bacterium]
MGAPPEPLLLTLDRGNTTLDAMLRGGDLGKPRRARLRSDDDGALRAFLGDLRPALCVGVTVVRDGLSHAEVELRGLELRLQLADRDIRCPLQLDYRTPQTLGADRWVAAVAAHRRVGGATVVVDCGSATTVDFVAGDGTFCGGAIAPGLPAMAEGMQRVTPQLPKGDPAGSVAIPSPSTTVAVHTGLAMSFCGAVERLVADTLAGCDGSAAVVITGGHAEHYLRHGRLQVDHVPDLVHQGLAAIAAGAAGQPCSS